MGITFSSPGREMSLIRQEVFKFRLRYIDYRPD